MKNPITLILLLTTILLFTCLLLPEMLPAQSAPAPPGAPAPSPIDGGLVLLAAAGGGYAIKKLRDRKE